MTLYKPALIARVEHKEGIVYTLTQKGEEEYNAMVDSYAERNMIQTLVGTLRLKIYKKYITLSINRSHYKMSVAQKLIDGNDMYNLDIYRVGIQ